MGKYLVIGSSGFLGQQVSQLLGGDLCLTHFRTPKLPNSLKYDFFEDDLPVELDESTMIIFTASVHMNQPQEKVRAGMNTLLDRVDTHRFIFISSDAVFDGEQGNYSEEDVPNPITVYGRNLRISEQLVQARCASYCIIRPSYIYGFVNGELDRRLSNTRDVLLAGGSFFGYDDMFKSPLSYLEVADSVTKVALSNYTGILHVAGERMSSYEFQRQAMNALGVDTSGLLRQSMPNQPGYLHDTSLDITKWQNMMNVHPIPISRGLADAN